MRFKKVVTEGLVASGTTTSIATPRGIIEDPFKNVSKLSTAESTQARGGDCQGVYREAPGDQQLFGVFPGTGLKCPSN